MSEFKLFDTVETSYPYDSKLNDIHYRGFLLYKFKSKDKSFFRKSDKSFCETIELLYSPGCIIKQNYISMKSCRMVLNEKVNLDIEKYCKSFYG